MPSIAALSENISSLLSSNPSVLALQGSMVAGAFLLVFLVFYATRDIMLRTHSFLYQLVSIVLVAALPVFGFLLYLLIRPARTVKERKMEHLLHEVANKIEKMQRKPVQGQQQQQHGHKHEGHQQKKG